MRLDAPGWWYGASASAMPRLLQPAGWLVGQLGMRRWRRTTPYRATLPVICIGNFTVGGTGKTPLALALVQMLKDIGERPVCLSRGYGGSLRGPHRVERGQDVAATVGDEPLLLAAAAPTYVARDRVAGARAIEAAVAAGTLSATVIVMDDGMQNPSLRKDLTLAVIDGKRGLGNGRVMPAGPLRLPVAFQAGLADVVIFNGAQVNGMDGGAALAGKPRLHATVAPTAETGWLDGQAVVAYAGIGNPDRFFEMLRRLGAKVEAAIAFGDHQALANGDAQRILTAASQRSALIVTTEKDFVRLAGLDGERAALRAASRIVPVHMTFAADDAEVLRELVSGKLAARRAMSA